MMGLNISNDDFWEISPDIFALMSKAYDIKRQEDWLPYRRLMTVIANVNGNKMQEKDFMYLPHYDGLKEKVEPIILTPEEIKKITEEHIKLGIINGINETGSKGG